MKFGAGRPGLGQCTEGYSSACLRTGYLDARPDARSLSKDQRPTRDAHAKKSADADKTSRINKKATSSEELVATPPKRLEANLQTKLGNARSAEPIDAGASAHPNVLLLGVSSLPDRTR
jgi:hypothetical protein